MRHAEILAALRKPGRLDEQYRECLEALASTLHATNPICEALDRAIREIEDYEEGQRAVAEMRADDLDNQRLAYLDRGELDAQSGAIPAWMTREGATA